MLLYIIDSMHVLVTQTTPVNFASIVTHVVVIVNF